jgi:predicted ester cyclase
MGQGDEAAGRALLAQNYVDHAIPGVGKGGREALIAAVLAVRSAFPDIQPVSVRVVARGRHTGSDFMGMPASGRAIEWNEVHVFRHAGGKLTDHRGVFDLMGILRQLQSPAG